MSLKPLNDLTPLESDKRIKIRVEKFMELWEELNEMELPKEVSSFINREVDHINNLEGKGDVFKALGRSQSAILKRIKDEMGLVPANYHRNMWLGLGMAIFGVPMGVALGLSLQNMAFIGIGIPIGLAIGIGIGISADSRAKQEGKQLRFEA
jgi:hypothetical protein